MCPTLTRWDFPPEHYLTTDGTSFTWMPVPSLEPPAITKCHSCGSRDFREHAGFRICSYCRSEA